MDTCTTIILHRRRRNPFSPPQASDSIQSSIQPPLLLPPLASTVVHPVAEDVHPNAVERQHDEQAGHTLEDPLSDGALLHLTGKDSTSTCEGDQHQNQSAQVDLEEVAVLKEVGLTSRKERDVYDEGVLPSTRFPGGRSTRTPWRSPRA
jgi:hypothetical protein